MTKKKKKEGSAGARPIVHDQAYITEVEFGTPPQKLKMILDTGSSDVFVYASQLVTQFNVEDYETGVLTFIRASWVQSSDTIYRVNDQGPWAPRYKPDSSKTAKRIDKAVWGVEYREISMPSSSGCRASENGQQRVVGQASR